MIHRKIGLTLAFASTVILTHLPGYALEFSMGSEDATSRFNHTLEVAATAQFDSQDIDSLHIITDNDAAFHSKLQLIDSAKESIKMIYFIYADDHTSSVVSKKLIAAAARGVKVELLVDYNTNYINLDLFSMLEREAQKAIRRTKSNGSLTIRFYNQPTKNVALTAALLSLGCQEKLSDKNDPHACSDEKLRQLDLAYFNGADSKTIAEENRYNVIYRTIGQSGLFLSGFYSKDFEVMAMAIQNGVQADLMALQNTPGENQQKLSKEDIENIKTFLQIVWKSYTSDNIAVRLANKIKLKFAYLMMSEDVNPLNNLIEGTLPIRVKESEAFKHSSRSRAKDLNHITDYTHHKLLLVDGQTFQLGGRNIEDSYHVEDSKHMTRPKYLFMDTDVLVRLNRSSQKLLNSFDRLWNYKKMVATLKQVRAQAPNQVVANLMIIRTECEASFDSESELYKQCISQAISSPETTFYSLAQREDRQLGHMNKMAQEYQKIMASDKMQQKLGNAPGLEITAAKQKLLAHMQNIYPEQLKNSKVYYLENLPFAQRFRPTDGAQSEQLKDRQYGLDYPRFLGNEHRGSLFERTIGSSKNIHAAWYAALEKTCALAVESKTPTQILIHNAYYAPTSDMLSYFADMSSGKLKCPNVSAEIVTNSIETTDLAIVNLFGRRAMKAFYKYHYIPAKNGAKIRYFEYQAKSGTEGKAKRSLHSKVMVFDGDIAIGSANSDYRSFMMDTNNAIYISNAKEIVGDYLNHLHSYQKTNQPIEDVTENYVVAQYDKNHLEQLTSSNDPKTSRHRSKFESLSNLINQLAEVNSQSTDASKKLKDIQVVDALDNAYFDAALKQYKIDYDEYKVLTSENVADAKLGFIGILRVIERLSESIVTPWVDGEYNSEYRKQEIEICTSNVQDIPPHNHRWCTKEFDRSNNGTVVRQRRQIQQKNDAKEKDGLAKLI